MSTSPCPGHLVWQWHYQAFKTFKTGEILPKSVI
jgi:hypothetical protein